MPEKIARNILIVDDTPANLRALTLMLEEQGYQPRPVSSGKLALQAAQSDPPDLILLDIMMPEMDGFELCRLLKQNQRLRNIPIIFLSALNETADKVKAFAAGGVDYITKPFQSAEVRARVATHLQLRQLQIELERHNHHLQDLVREQIKEIFEAHMATIFSMAKLAESRDDDTGKHLERVQASCMLLATRLSESAYHNQQADAAFIENIYYASPLHDLGKIAIPDHILLKSGKLTPEEFEQMKTHTILGAQTLEAVQSRYAKNLFLSMGIEIARSHHEKWDGSGYPQGLAGSEIPLSARIVGIADVYDALTSKRCYKPAISHEKSCEIILGLSGSHFDPEMVEVFRDIHNL